MPDVAWEKSMICTVHLIKRKYFPKKKKKKNFYINESQSLSKEIVNLWKETET